MSCHIITKSNLGRIGETTDALMVDDGVRGTNGALLQVTVSSTWNRTSLARCAETEARCRLASVTTRRRP
jgi:hypothetical protein